MTGNRVLFSLLAVTTFSYLFLPDPSEAQPGTAAVLEVALLEGLPVHIKAAALSREALSTPVPLGVKFQMANSSSEMLRTVEFIANVSARDGQLKGFHGFTLKVNLAPGEERHFRNTTGSFQLEQGDRVELIPARIAGSRSSWDIDRPDRMKRAASAESSDSPMKDGPTDTCDARCAAKEESCSDKCTCGLAEFSCSCGVGTLTYTCKCYKCV
jgi:hypothetical protein